MIHRRRLLAAGLIGSLAWLLAPVVVVGAVSLSPLSLSPPATYSAYSSTADATTLAVLAGGRWYSPYSNTADATTGRHDRPGPGRPKDR